MDHELVALLVTIVASSTFLSLGSFVAWTSMAHQQKLLIRSLSEDLRILVEETATRSSPMAWNWDTLK